MRTVRSAADREDPRSAKPRARRDGLVVQDLADETLVYDLQRDRAHCLNRTAALVWRRCDGRTSVAGLANLLQDAVGLPAAEAVVWMALERLGKAHLLQERITPPGGAGRYSRREVLRRLSIAAGLAVLLPAVQSILAPEAVQAASGVTAQACFQDPNANAGKCCVDSNPRRICRRVRRQGFCTGAAC